MYDVIDIDFMDSNIDDAISICKSIDEKADLEIIERMGISITPMDGFIRVSIPLSIRCNLEKYFDIFENTVFSDENICSSNVKIIVDSDDDYVSEIRRVANVVIAISHAFTFNDNVKLSFCDRFIYQVSSLATYAAKSYFPKYNHYQNKSISYNICVGEGFEIRNYDIMVDMYNKNSCNFSMLEVKQLIGNIESSLFENEYKVLNYPDIGVISVVSRDLLQ